MGPAEPLYQDVNFRILDAQCSSSTAIPFGEVRGGTLTVECLYNSATLIKESSEWRSNTLLILDRDIVDEDDLVLISREIIHPDIALTKANSGVFGPVMVHCLFVGSKANGSVSNVELYVDYALVIRASTSSFKDAYERIGLLAHHSIDQADYHNWFQASSVGILQIH